MSQRSQAGFRSRPVAAVVWQPLAVGGLLAAVGLVGLALRLPWLFPSLGPTAYIIAVEPDRPAARFYSTIVGHLVGFGAGASAVLLLGAPQTSGVLASQQLVPIRVAATVLAGVVMMVCLVLLRAPHPPAAATMLLVTLGGIEPTKHLAVHIALGVLLLALLGEGVRHLRLRVFPEPATT